MTAVHSDTRTAWLLVFLALLLTIYAITIDYASQRPGGESLRLLLIDHTRVPSSTFLGVRPPGRVLELVLVISWM